MSRFTRHWTLISLIAVLCLLISATGVSADDETAAAGNGGTGAGNANGGAAVLGDLNSGDNAGNALGLGDTGGGEISGGSVVNSTDVTAALDGGTGIADATGGDENIAFTLDPVPPAPNPEPGPGPAPVPPAPTPEPDLIPQLCVNSVLGTSCSTSWDCFDIPPYGTGCLIPECAEALGTPGLPCMGWSCEPGPRATTNCSLNLPPIG